MDIRTVKRNSRELRALLDNPGKVVSYEQDGGFRGRECSPVADYGDKTPWAWLRNEVFRKGCHARITEAGGKYTVHFHSNSWLYIYPVQASTTPANTGATTTKGA